MHKYTVSTVERITPSTLLLTLHLKDGEAAFSHHAGQYAAISFTRHGRPTPMRCFSIVSAPYEENILQFSMRARGHFTKGIAELTPGSTVTVEGPFGGFVMTNPRDLKTIFLAGGIGITPFMSMVRQANEQSYQNEICLFYSCANQDDVPFYTELQQLQVTNPRLEVRYFIGQGPTDKLQGASVYTGRITPEAIDMVASSNYGDKSFFICGPPPFMNGMLKLLRSKGVATTNLITEAFSQGPNRQTGKIRNWPFTMYAFGAVGMVVASFTIMITDLLKTLPSGVFAATQQQTPQGNVNARQKDLDQLVNSFASAPNPAPSSIALTTPVTSTSTTPQKTTAVGTSTPSSGTSKRIVSTPTPAPTTTTPTPTVTSTPTPAPTTTTPTPTPAPTPVCKTSPSGVTTCK